MKVPEELKPTATTIELFGIRYRWLRNTHGGRIATDYHWYHLYTPGTATVLRAEDPAEFGTAWIWRTMTQINQPVGAYRCVTDGSAPGLHLGYHGVAHDLRALPESVILWGDV